MMNLFVLDARGNPIVGAACDLVLKSTDGSSQRLSVRFKSTKRGQTLNVAVSPGFFIASLTVQGYLPCRRFISLTATEDLHFYVVPEVSSVTSIKCHSPREYDVMVNKMETDIEKACLLNILSKSRVTRAGDGTVFTYLGAVELAHVDRIWFRCYDYSRLLSLLKIEVAEGTMKQADHSLHSYRGQKPEISFKTLDPYGNLQITMYPAVTDQPDLLELDIDDAAGLGHVFQVLDHALTGRKTHPYDIYSILLRTQRLDPGYELVVA